MYLKVTKISIHCLAIVVSVHGGGGGGSSIVQVAKGTGSQVYFFGNFSRV